MRLFVGIELPDEIKRALHELQAELKQRGVNGAWKSIANLHITLEFLGNIGPNLVPLLTDTLSHVACKLQPFILSIAGLGVFPSIKRPQILWSAVGESINELHHLRDEIHSELAKKGFALEERPFKPHITLASRPQLGDLDLSDFKTKKIGGFNVVDIVLFESRAVNGHSIYTDLFRTSLNTALHNSH